MQRSAARVQQRRSGERREGGRCSRRRAVDVYSRVLLLPLGAPVLEPDLHLGLRQVQRERQVQSLADGQIARLFEFVLQRYELLVGEGGPSSPRFAAFGVRGALLLRRSLLTIGVLRFAVTLAIRQGSITRSI